jgi:hypothetical protein
MRAGRRVGGCGRAGTPSSRGGTPAAKPLQAAVAEACVVGAGRVGAQARLNVTGAGYRRQVVFFGRRVQVVHEPAVVLLAVPHGPDVDGAQCSTHRQPSRATNSGTGPCSRPGARTDRPRRIEHSVHSPHSSQPCRGLRSRSGCGFARRVKVIDSSSCRTLLLVIPPPTDQRLSVPQAHVAVTDSRRQLGKLAGLVGRGKQRGLADVLVETPESALPDGVYVRHWCGGCDGRGTQRVLCVDRSCAARVRTRCPAENTARGRRSCYWREAGSCVHVLDDVGECPPAITRQPE